MAHKRKRCFGGSRRVSNNFWMDYQLNEIVYMEKKVSAMEKRRCLRARKRSRHGRKRCQGDGKDIDMIKDDLCTINLGLMENWE